MLAASLGEKDKPTLLRSQTSGKFKKAKNTRGASRLERVKLSPARKTLECRFLDGRKVNQRKSTEEETLKGVRGWREKASEVKSPREQRLPQRTKPSLWRGDLRGGKKALESS